MTEAPAESTDAENDTPSNEESGEDPPPPDYSLLPVELVAQIFSFLRVDEVLRAARTCRCWYAGGAERLRVLSLGRQDTVDDSMMGAVGSFGSVDTLILDGCSELSGYGLGEVRRQCGKLRRLTIRTMVLSWTGFSELCLFEHIEELEVTNTSLLSDVSTVPKFAHTLKKLVLHNTCIVRLWQLQHFTSLQWLDVSYPTTANLHALTLITTLTTLAIREVRPQFAQDFEFPFRSLHFLSTLRRLEMHAVNVYGSFGGSSPDAERAVWAALRHILLACTSLRELVLDDIRSTPVTDENIKLWISACPPLEVVELRGHNTLTSASVAHIAAHCGSTLRSLKCYNMCLLTDRAVAEISTHCQKLQSLAVPWCDRLTDASLAALRVGCRHLQQLDISGCHQLTAKALTSVAGRGSLKRVRMYGAHGCASAVRILQSRGVHVLYSPKVGGGDTETKPMQVDIVQSGQCSKCNVTLPTVDHLRHKPTMQDHMAVCPNAEGRLCPNTQYGCTALLRPREVLAHMAHCRSHQVVCPCCGGVVSRPKYYTHLALHRNIPGAMHERHCGMILFGCRHASDQLGEAVSHFQRCREAYVTQHPPSHCPWAYPVTQVDLEKAIKHLGSNKRDRSAARFMFR